MISSSPNDSISRAIDCGLRHSFSPPSDPCRASIRSFIPPIFLEVAYSRESKRSLFFPLLPPFDREDARHEDAGFLFRPESFSRISASDLDDSSLTWALE